MEQTHTTSLDEAVQLVDEARRQIEIEIAALHRLLNEGSIHITDYTTRQAELRQEKAAPIQVAVSDALSQSYSGTKRHQARYLIAAYDHLATGVAKLEAFAWKDAQLKAKLHSEAAYQQARSEAREAIQREVHALTREQLFPSPT
ncbi:hypothetical protein C2W62_22115 [Candidatus Entotheonella serta]|nr:hypothetical protein C2W62_22115 [Candidatus Entotheonella serta]